MTGPTINRGSSRQDHGTPWPFIKAVNKRFHMMNVDLAATKENAKAEHFYGPGSPAGEDSLLIPWYEVCGRLWLNPPFSNIAPWAKKCAMDSVKGAEIFFLVPSSTGANWFRDWVWGRSMIYFLSGRLTFEGSTDPYPKDCLLAHYGPDPDFRIWDWKKDLTYSWVPDTTSPSSPI